MTRARAAADLVGLYARHPDRLTEVGRWWAQRDGRPFDLATPWWNFAAIGAVERALPAGASVFEYGGGGSTAWLTAHGCATTTVEDDADWAEQLRLKVPAATTLHVPPSPTGTVESEARPGRFFDAYVAAIDDQADGSLDLVIVDGRARVACGVRAAAKVQPGGMLLLDDSHRARYAPLASYLHSWSSTVHRGLKAGGGALVSTTIWVKPAR